MWQTKCKASDFHASVECLLGKVDLQRIVGHLNRYYSEQPVHKIKIDDDDVWQDMIVVYKARQLDVSKQVRICVQNQPAVDTGGVRRQVYSLVYDEFLLNKHLTLFDGPSQSCRPVCTAESRSSGLFKVLGKMVGHSIVQEGIGFLYFSPVCYVIVVRWRRVVYVAREWLVSM